MSRNDACRISAEQFSHLIGVPPRADSRFAAHNGASIGRVLGWFGG